MAKGDICKVDGCEKEVYLRRTACITHVNRWKKFKSYDDPLKTILPDGIVKICRRHGELSIEKCLNESQFYDSKKKKNIKSSGYRCKQCRYERRKKWEADNPEKMKAMRVNHKNHPDAAIRSRRNSLKKNYAMTLEQYNNLVVLQNNKCAICKKHESVIDYQTKQPRFLSVDHCHETNKNRGLLCNKCNHAFGLLLEDIEIMQNMIIYKLAHG